MSDRWRVPITVYDRGRRRRLGSVLAEAGWHHSGQGAEMFVYTSTAKEAESVRQLALSELRGTGGGSSVFAAQQWLDAEQRWKGAPPAVAGGDGVAGAIAAVVIDGVLNRP